MEGRGGALHTASLLVIFLLPLEHTLSATDRTLEYAAELILIPLAYLNLLPSSLS